MVAFWIYYHIFSTALYTTADTYHYTPSFMALSNCSITRTNYYLSLSYNYRMRQARVSTACLVNSSTNTARG